jgi:hypothetical protein
MNCNAFIQSRGSNLLLMNSYGKHSACFSNTQFTRIFSNEVRKKKKKDEIKFENLKNILSN